MLGNAVLDGVVVTVIGRASCSMAGVLAEYRSCGESRAPPGSYVMVQNSSVLVDVVCSSFVIANSRHGQLIDQLTGVRYCLRWVVVAHEEEAVEVGTFS